MFIVHLTQSLVVLLALIGAAFWLKRRGIVDADNAQGFTRIVTELLLPALVFASLSRHALRPELMLPGLVMLASVLTGLFVAWLLGLALKLRPGQLGALVLVAGFGSSASLGYALIAQVFPDNGKAMLDAVVLNSIGSTIPVFVIGVPIAAHFGSREGGSGDSGAAALRALRSFFHVAVVRGADPRCRRRLRRPARQRLHGDALPVPSDLAGRGAADGGAEYRSDAATAGLTRSGSGVAAGGLG